MIPLCLDQGVGCLPWSPLARGPPAVVHANAAASSSRLRGSDQYAEELYGNAHFDVVDRVREVAGERGLPPAQIAGRGRLASRPSAHRS